MFWGPFGTPADVLAYLLLLAVGLGVWRLMWRGRRLPGVSRSGTLLIGHRGTRTVRGENTLAAFRYAFDAGLDGIEFDVRSLRDGVLAIVHDADVDGAPVAGMAFAELRERAPSVPTLEELFALARDYPGRLLNLEIKVERGRPPGLERAVVRAVQTSGLEGRVLVSSFDPLALLRVRLMAPALRVAWVYGGSGAARPGRRAWPGWLHVDALHPHRSLADAALVRTAHARGVAVNAWTVNDASEIGRLRAQGVDAIIGDDPETLLRSARGG